MASLSDYLAALDAQEARHGRPAKLIPGSPEWDAHNRNVCREMYQQMRSLEAEYGLFSERQDEDDI